MPPRMHNPYRNPVIDRDFPDPSVLLASDGWYYCYATQYIGVDGAENIPCARSTDLVHWELVGDVMPNKPSWASTTQDFWAPHVLEDGGTFYLYFSAAQDGGEGMAIGVATASSPTGPFVGSGEVLVGGEGFEHIDPMPFDDPRTGRKLLYWGSGFKPIRVRELAADRLRFAADSHATDVLHPLPEQPFERLIEGAFVVYREGYYYLFYSGDDCWQPSTYALMVARSNDALGPFRRLAEHRGSSDSVILRHSDRWHAPGQNSVIADHGGTDWLVYHAVDARRPRDPVTNTWRRPTLLDRISYVDGWPTVAGGVASADAREGPVVSY